MKKKEKKEEKKRRPAPIVDGDARPDMPLHPDIKKENGDNQRDKKFEKERISDVNTLEDFKDAKFNDDEKK